MSKDTAIAKLTPVFRRYGYEGASLSMLSKATGLGRASLYHHFPGGKAEMAQAVLAYVAERVQTHVLAPLQAEGQPLARIRNMATGISNFYNDGQDACFLAVFSMGEADTLFHDLLQQSLKTWITRLAEALIDAGIAPDEAQVRSRSAVMSIQGALVLVRILKDTTPFEDLMAQLPERLLDKALMA